MTSFVSNGSFKINDVIPITITFDNVVTVSGTPQLTLETGTSDAVVNYAQQVVEVIHLLFIIRLLKDIPPLI